MKPLAEYPDAHLRIFDRPPLPEPDATRTVFLVGICGTGMGSLADLLKQAGYEVRGSDQAIYPPMSTRLQDLGIEILPGYDPSHLDPAPDLVVVGNACIPTHPEASYARDRRIAQASFPETVAHYFLRDRRSIVVAGTHGKTTTTGMVVHLLRSANLDPGFLVGGVMQNGGGTSAIGTGPHFVIEGDEYDCAYFDKRPKFMHYQPTIAIVTSLELDHTDIYESDSTYRAAFRELAAVVPQEGHLVLNADVDDVQALGDHTPAGVISYGLERGDVRAVNIRPDRGGQHFSLRSREWQMDDVFLPVSGRHNLSNALAAMTVALVEGVAVDVVRSALSEFGGLKRRQELRAEIAGVAVVDDFAHHPTAVRATVEGVKERWPARRLVAVFEPRSNSSRRKVFEPAYVRAFADADVVMVSAPPFRHNDIKEDFMDVGVVTRRLSQDGKQASAHATQEELRSTLSSRLRTGDVVVIMSNGGFGGIHEWLIDHLQNSVD